MGGNFKKGIRGVAVLCAAVTMVAWTAGGATLAAEGFATTGQGGAGWYWLHPQSHAQWEFFGLPSGSDPYIALEAFLCLSLPNGSTPAEIEVRFLIGTVVGQSSGLRVARLSRIQSNADYAMYFGQVFIPRREIGLGSRLTVRLEGGPIGLPVGVHPHSVRLAMGSGGGAPMVSSSVLSGQGGSLEEVYGSGGAATPFAAAAPVRTLPDSAVINSAPFLTPGTYRGTLGWSGPYDTPTGMGLYRVNLRVDEVVTLRVETTSPCLLVLVDPTGRKVGEIEGSSWLGLEYRATVGGAWQVHIICREGGPRFPYTLTLGIRR